MNQSFIALIERAIKEYWDQDALTDYKGATLQYKDVARKIEKLHIIFEESGVKRVTALLFADATVPMGSCISRDPDLWTVAVPVLHEFKAENIHYIVNHSDARLLLVGDMSGLSWTKRKCHRWRVSSCSTTIPACLTF